MGNEALTFEQRIEMTSNKFAAAINESGLHPSILKMMLQNISYQLDIQLMQARPEEGGSDNAKSES